MIQGGSAEVAGGKVNVCLTRPVVEAGVIPGFGELCHLTEAPAVGKFKDINK